MDQAKLFAQSIRDFLRANWIGTVVILIATLIFFGPMVIRIGSYSEGGDAMFNAWTLSRNHHCILRDGCPSYVDGNIFFPRQDTMLYSETQLSAGLLTLPLHFINQNPIFAYNVWAIASFFFMGWFMYLLAKYLSRNNEFISTIAGLIFAFAPFRMAAIAHLQNSSIFYLPLIFLLIFKYFDTGKRGYLIGLFAALVLQFYASWYQMVFALLAVGILLGGMFILKLKTPRQLFALSAVVVLALASTYPLAKEYMRFSKTSKASFSIQSQAEYSSSLSDYVIPDQGTLLGKVYHVIAPERRTTSFNSDSGAYYGFILYGIGAAVLVTAYKYRKRGKEAARQFKMTAIFATMALAGFIISLGPLLKIKGSSLYQNIGEGISYAIPLPYILVDMFLPQLSFLRALGRAGVLILFALCCLLAYSALRANKIKFYQNHRNIINGVIIALLVIELMPLQPVRMRSTDYSYNMSVPAVYEYIKSHKEVDNIVILSGDWDYPDAGIPIKLPEQVLWAGYHNKNIFNGYSGYLPPSYYAEFYDFVDFKQDDIAKLKKMNLRYVMVDKQLSTSRPSLANDVSSVLGKDHKVYEDKRYVLFKVD